MIDRRLLLLGLPAGAMGFYLVQGIISPSEIEFTRAAPAAPHAVELRPVVSTAYLELPLDLSRVAARTETIVAQRLAAAYPLPPDPSCARRPAAPECTARNEGQVEAAGPIRFEINANAMRLKVPVRVTETAAGIDGSKPLQTSVTFAFAIRHQDGTGFDITRLDEGAPDGTAAATPGQQRALRQAESRLRPAALAAHDELRQVLASLPVSEATQQAWNALSEPVELGRGSNVWLRPIPELVGAGQIVATSGQARFRIPMAARLSIEDAPRGAAPPKRPAIHGQILTQTGSNIRIAMNLPLENVQRVADAALVKAGPLELKPDRFGPSVMVSVRRAKAYTSIRQIAFELDISATRFEGETFTGKAHLVGRPHLDAAARLVTLADLALTPPAVREASPGKPHQNAPRLTAEPIASRLAEAARFDLNRDLTEAVPRFSGLLHQRIGEALTIAARIEQANPVSIETTRNGAWLIADLYGELTLTYDRGGSAAVAAAPAQQRVTDAAPRQVAPSTSPEVLAAAVVSATAGAAAAQIARQTSALPANAAPLSQGVPSSAAGGTVTIMRPAPTPFGTSTNVATAAPRTLPAGEQSAAPKAASPAGQRHAGSPAGAAAADPARPAPSSVKAKVLAKPKTNTKVAGAKANWVPF